MTDEAKPQMTSAHLKEMADLYHVPITDETVKNIAGDNVTPEKAKAFEEYVKMTAQGLYPTLAPQIKAGIPTSYLLDPYRQVAKQMLGHDTELDFQTDPMATVALTGSTDPQTGRPAPMSLEQWKQHIRTTPSFGYDMTPQAIALAHQAVQSLHESFGGK